jgi:hypothetical protein
MKKNILDKMNSKFGGEMQVNVEFVEKILPTPQGKFLHIVPYRETLKEQDS